MPDYSKGKIYTLRCRTDDTLIYVGSTIQPLCERMSTHRVDSRIECKKNRLIYRTINGDWDNWFIELHELYPCSSKEELVKREGEIIRLIANLNTQIPGRTFKEWCEVRKDELVEKSKEYRQEHKQEIAERKKTYYQDHKQEIAERKKEKITCECGCLISKSDLSRHKKTPKHLNLISQPIIEH